MEELVKHINDTNASHFPLQQIYYGAPGTGKSYDINAITKEYDTIRTTFHPDSDYSTFVGAYKPTMEEVDVQIVPVAVAGGITLDTNKGTYKEKRITYKFVKQAFLKAYLSAWKKYAEAEGEEVAPQFLVIEEINRGNCAQIFGDLFQLLDRQDNGFSSYPIEADSDMQREIQHAFKEEAVYKIEGKLDVEGAVKDYTSNYGETLSDDIQDGRILLLPKNLYIWATMNTSDQSLFPIDSAFKRRWDWHYVKIADAKKGFKIKCGDEECDWWTFVSAMNTKISEETSSDDKKLGYYFCKPDKDGKYISEERFVGKVMFYLWNDVFKDDDTEVFNVTEGSNAATFEAFYKDDNKVNVGNVRKFLVNIVGESNLHKNKEEEEENADGMDEEYINENADESSNTMNRDQYSVNGNGSYGKCRVPFEAVKVYASQNPQMSASELTGKWTALNITHVPYLVETEQSHEQRASNTKDVKFSTKSKRLELPNGEVVYVSNQFDPTRIKELMGKLENSDLGVHIALTNI